jgi:hypothetical protein
MLAYLSAETSFLRAFGNRSLLLIVLCALTRTGDSIAKGSVLGVSIDISPAVIIVAGPVLALLLIIALKIEADALLLAREAVLDEASKMPKLRVTGRSLYVVFAVPTLAASFMTVQFILKLVPSGQCDDWNWPRQFRDFSKLSGTPSTFCIGKALPDAPWIYPPWQTYFYVGCVATCAYLTYRMAKDWQKARGGRL